ncbi:MAG: undecaprenyl-diphosphate phosphatase [Patescibacteria group bacterium]|nr:undecaprenyl-diphosphate phosphatase [Patescibacteria group bacterium]
MNSFQAFVLGIVQGITEFFPVSSSGHLILLPKVFGWKEQSLALDAFLHLGTGIAVLFYFRKEWWGMFTSLFTDLKQGVFTDAVVQIPFSEFSADSRQLVFLVLASIPAGMVGILLNDWVGANLRSPKIIAGALLIVALIMIIADTVGLRVLEELRLIPSLEIGFSQILALIPGVSRSGITISAGLFSGLTVQSATRFSFLLATPVVLGAGLWGLFTLTSLDTSFSVLVTGFVSSFLFGFIAIEFFLGLVDNIGLVPFAVYRIVLALVVFLLFI